MIDTQKVAKMAHRIPWIFYTASMVPPYDYSIISKPGDGIGTILITGLQTSFDIHFLPATQLCVYVCVCVHVLISTCNSMKFNPLYRIV